ncbi:hypothetical protein H477_5833 [[Clostridium] sordellii ATCC 9714]|nr:hypothetical protein H477_5833 [[Clostridium] sordellii ATCC 9714] [Paeniclostridium sordellii ATCC 9714]
MMKNFKMKNQILISTYIVVLAFLLLNIHSVLKILGQSLQYLNHL